MKGNCRNANERLGTAAASRLCASLLALALLFALAPAASAQSCAMCYDSAAQQNAQAARALNTGILILLLPALLLFAGVLVTAYRRADRADDDE